MKRTITVKEAAALLGCGERNIRKLIAKGKLKACAVRSSANGRNQYVLDVDTLPPDMRAAYDATQAQQKNRRPELRVLPERPREAKASNAAPSAVMQTVLILAMLPEAEYELAIMALHALREL